MNYHRGYVVNGDYKAGGLFQQVFKVDFGDPAKITQCRMDGCCPECGRFGSPVYDKSAQSSDRTRLVDGIDFIRDDGITAACCKCGWSF